MRTLASAECRLVVLELGAGKGIPTVIGGMLISEDACRLRIDTNSNLRLHNAKLGWLFSAQDSAGIKGEGEFVNLARCSGPQSSSTPSLRWSERFRPQSGR